MRGNVKDAHLLQKMGYATIPMEEAENRPLVRLAEDLGRDEGRVHLNNGGKVVPVLLESTLSAAAAPDHLISGLIENVLNVCFEQLGANAKQRYLKVRII